MPVSAATKKALNLKKLKLPPSIPVVRVEVEDYTDWDGDPALKVLVVLDESVDPEKVDGNAVGDLKRAMIASESTVLLCSPTSSLRSRANSRRPTTRREPCTRTCSPMRSPNWSSPIRNTWFASERLTHWDFSR